MRQLIGLLGIIGIAHACFTGPALAQRRNWVDVGTGWGRVHVGGSRSTDAGAFVLDFTGGHWLSDEVAIGLRLGGWTLEGFNLYDPREGEAISEVFGLLKVRPLTCQSLMLTLGGGWASYTANDPALVTQDGGGVGWRAEVEWDAWRSDRWSLGAALAASWGSLDPDSDAQGTFGYGGGALLARARWRW